MSTGEAFSPVSGAERLHSVDVVRGAAILGILIVNMGLFFNPIYSELLGFGALDDSLDRAVKKGILAFAQGKFYTIFSILFGFGMAIQLEKFRDRGISFGNFWVRRMLVLMGIGLIHGLFLWFGDILLWYSLAGLALFLFRKAKPLTLKIWAVVLLSVPLLLMTAVTLLVMLGGAVPDAAEAMNQQFEQQAASIESALETARDRYPVAGLAETVQLNIAQWKQVAGLVAFMLPNVLGMFVIGLLFARHRLFHDTAAHLSRIRGALVWLIPLAIVTNGTVALLYERVHSIVPSGLSLALQIVGTVGSLSGCLTYIFLLLIAYHSPRTHRFVAPIGAVGRMALTNYLTHSIVFTTLANGYGAGLYGRVSLFTGLVLTLATFVVQIAFSNAWLRRFRFGPMEWLWRSLTYGKIQPLRRAPYSPPS
jgi:uncharacterized protein